MCNNIPAIVEYIKHRRKSAEALYIPVSRSQFIDEAKWKSMSDYIDYSKYSSHISCVHKKKKIYENIFKTAWTHPYINYKYLCLFQKQYLKIVH